MVELILFLSLWLIDEYIASLITMVMVPIFVGILIVSLISEFIEKSKVPRVYFYFLILSILIPLIIGLFFMTIYGGKLSWF